MEIHLHKTKSSIKDFERLYLKARSIKNLNFSSGLMLLLENEIHNEDGSKTAGYEIKKIEFLSAAEIDGLDGEFVIAHYIGTWAEIQSIVISELPNRYYNAEYLPKLFNYVSYKEICEMTGEKVMNFKEYIDSVILSDNCSVNSLEKHGQSLLNYNEQMKLSAK